MSFDYIKYLSFKNKTITLACNNIRPLIWEKVEYKGTTEELIKLALIQIHDGEWHPTWQVGWKFNYAFRLFKEHNKDKFYQYDKILYQYHDLSKLSAHEREAENLLYENTRKQFIEDLYKEYINMECKKGKYVLCLGHSLNFYFVSHMPSKNEGYYYSTMKKDFTVQNLKESRVKIFTNLAEAQYSSLLLDDMRQSNVIYDVENMLPLRVYKKFIHKEDEKDKFNVSCFETQDSEDFLKLNEEINEFLSNEYGFLVESYNLDYNKKEDLLIIDNIVWDTTE